MCIGNGKRFSTNDGPRQSFEIQRAGELPDVTKDDGGGSYVPSYPTDDKEEPIKLSSLSATSRLADWLQTQRRLLDRRVSFKGSNGRPTVFHGKPRSQLRSVTCHMVSHSVTYHPTQLNVHRLNPSQKTGTGTPFTYPGGMEG